MDSELDKLRELRKSLTLGQIGALPQYRKTGERIRQLLSKRWPKKCEIHNSFITDKCRWCVLDQKRQQLIARLTKNGVYDEIARLSTRQRTREVSIDRARLVKKLHNKPYKMSYRQIAKHLNRDHATIIYLYNL